MTLARLHLDLAADIIELNRMGAEVSTFCIDNGIDGKTAYTLQLVCDEWFTNIVSHGYGKPAPKGRPISLSITKTDSSTLVLVFTDDALAFNPLALEVPNTTLSVEERKVGGLGIHFIRQMMSSCAYRRINDQNELTLIKKLDEPREETES